MEGNCQGRMKSDRILTINYVLHKLLMIVRLKFSAIWQQLVLCCLLVSCLFLLATPPASAAINDDRFEGNVFVLYGGNGSLVPPKTTLPKSRASDKATILVYYLDDSSDCKQYATVVSRMQAYYGRAADIIPVDVDVITENQKYTPDEAGYYYKGIVPQVVILDKSGKVVFDRQGQVPYEQVDDSLREVYNLLPRSESTDLKIRPVNEFSTELTDKS